MTQMLTRRGLLGLVGASLAMGACSRTERLPGQSAPVPRIGISLWYDFGDRARRILGLCQRAAEALGCQYQVYEHNFELEKQIDSVHTLAGGGCTAMMICNATDSDMAPVIDACNERGIYVVQFMRTISQEASPEAYQKAVDSAYYVGSVFEDERDNGAKLLRALCQGGSRRIVGVGRSDSESTFLQRWEGARDEAQAWNETHPDDPVEMLESVFVEKGSQKVAQAVDALLEAHPEADGLIEGGGGTDDFVGTLGSLANRGQTGRVRVATTEFMDDLLEQMETGAVAGATGGAYLDVVYAFLLAYQASIGRLEVHPGQYGVQLHFPLVLAATPQEYEDYLTHFVDDDPYHADELRALADEGPEAVERACQQLSMADVASRHAG